MRVVIVDSGVSKDLIFKYNIQGHSLCENKKITDSIGHGSAVTEIILQDNNNVEIYMLKIFENQIIVLMIFYVKL